MGFKPRQEDFTSEAGNKYTFQTVLPSVWAKIADQITDKHGKLLNVKAMPAILDNIVAVPGGLKMDDFTDWGELEEVVEAGFRFQRGRA
ncbi:hypothetical protein [Sporosarcina sp. FSL K6-1508]|uniref:hypothetical protein n=1 Tax=Sporosarcina sp. FSL K6-1508 TaxID=2921553 RepID=UPI0030F91B07